jgi:phage terminase small subunit
MAMNLKPFKEGDKLTPKQEKWIEEYIKTDSLTEATVNAGYKSKNPRAIGYQNSIRFKEVIDKRRLEISKEIKNNSIAELEDIFQFWTNVFKDENEYMKNRIKASELLAKSKGAFVERREIKLAETEWFVEE